MLILARKYNWKSALPMFISLFFVFSLNNNKFICGFDGDFIWCELLHIQNDLEFVIVNVQSWTGSFTFQVVWTPWANVPGTQYRWSWIPEWGQQVVATQSSAEFLVQEPWGTEWTIPIIPPVSEWQWNNRHFLWEKQSNKTRNYKHCRNTITARKKMSQKTMPKWIILLKSEKKSQNHSRFSFVVFFTRSKSFEWESNTTWIFVLTANLYHYEFSHFSDPI